jgi:hypothetical protein
MKIWVSVFLCFVSAKAVASVADSGRCPWKIPFTLTVQAEGTQHQYELARSITSGGWYDHNSDYGTVQSNDAIQVTIDTTGSYLSDSVKFSLASGILTYSKINTASGFGPPASFYTSVKIVFVHGRDSIASINISGGDSSQWGNGQASHVRYNFSISNLGIDNSNIFCTDTSFQAHGISYSSSSEQGYNASYYDFDEKIDDFTATSVTLSGLFLPITLGKSSIGSGSPLKVPFTIQVRASGKTSSSGYFVPGTGPGSPLNSVVMPDSQHFNFTVGKTYSLQNDTLRSNGESANESMVIVFAHGVDSIISITYTQNLSGVSTFFSVSSLRFDSSGIYTDDSSFQHHNTSLVIERSSTDYIGRHDYISSSSRFVASRVGLSGAFQPLTLQDSANSFKRMRLPFQLVIHSIGIMDSLGTTHTTANDLSIMVWHSVASRPDTLSFGSGTQSIDTSLEIDFVSGTDSVKTIKLALSNIAVYAGPWSQDQWGVVSTVADFMASDFVNDSDFVFSSDSSMCAHHITMTSAQFHKGYSFSGFSSDTALQFVASSVNLSGIFRPMHYACEAAVKEPLECRASLTVAASREGLTCSFSPSDRQRTLEAYSTLGVQAARLPISAGEIQKTIPNLAAGLYFVRLGNQVAKVIIQ